MKTKKAKNTNYIIGAWITGVILLIIVVGIFYTPYDPDKMSAADKLSGVSLAHIMGCDNFGRDIFSRVMVGGWNTLLVAGGTVLI